MVSATHRGAKEKAGGGKSAASPAASRRVAAVRGRKRVPIIGFRATDDDKRERFVVSDARRAGLTVGSYVRARALAKPETRAVRRPPVETAQLAQASGDAGRCGRNDGAVGEDATERRTRQTADDQLAAELLAAVKDFRATSEAIILAMGKHPHLHHVTHHDH